MIVINDSDKFEKIISNIEASKANIEEIFKETTGNMERINDTDSWKGLAQKRFSEKYNTLSNNYEPISNSLNIYINFMKQTIADYKEFEEQAMKDVEKNSTELNVNS